MSSKPKNPIITSALCGSKPKQQKQKETTQCQILMKTM